MSAALESEFSSIYKSHEHDNLSLSEEPVTPHLPSPSAHESHVSQMPVTSQLPVNKTPCHTCHKCLTCHIVTRCHTCLLLPGGQTSSKFIVFLLRGPVQLLQLLLVSTVDVVLLLPHLNLSPELSKEGVKKRRRNFALNLRCGHISNSGYVTLSHKDCVK